MSPYNYDNRKTDRERAAAAERGGKWFLGINEDLMKAGFSGRENMAEAINYAYEKRVIGKDTRNQAFEIHNKRNRAEHALPNVKK